MNWVNKGDKQKISNLLPLGYFAKIICNFSTKLTCYVRRQKGTDEFPVSRKLITFINANRLTAKYQFSPNPAYGAFRMKRWSADENIFLKYFTQLVFPHLYARVSGVWGKMYSKNIKFCVLYITIPSLHYLV